MVHSEVFYYLRAMPRLELPCQELIRGRECVKIQTALNV